jgi:hypothetical protein
MKRSQLGKMIGGIIIFLSAGLACAQATPTLTVSFTLPVATAIPSHSALTAPPPSSDLWYLLRGGAKLDQGWSVDTDPEGNIYFATYQQAVGDLFTDIVLYKLDSSGRELWQARWGTKFQEKAFIVQVSGDSVYVGGTTYSSSTDLMAGDMLVLAFDSATGDLRWKFTWGQGFGYEEVDGLLVEEDGIYISGWTTSEKTSCDVGLLKLDKQGNLLWKSVWGGDRWDEADGQMVMDDQYMYISGRINGDNILLGGDALLAMFNRSDGSYVRHVTWGGAQMDDALGITSDGTWLYPVGLTLSRGNGGQIFVLKYDKALNQQWEQVWGGPQGESTRSAAINPEGNILVAGETSSYGNGENDIALLSFSPEGALNWSRTWGGEKSEGALEIVMVGWNALISGNTKSFGSGQDDAILLKVNGQTGGFPGEDSIPK